MSAAIVDTLTDEFAVVDDLGRFAGIGRRFATRGEADGYIEWLRERRDEMERAAVENKRSGFEGGNEAWYRWNVGDLSGRRNGGEKDRSYRVIRRSVSPWQAVTR